MLIFGKLFPKVKTMLNITKVYGERSHQLCSNAGFENSCYPTQPKNNHLPVNFLPSFGFNPSIECKLKSESCPIQGIPLLYLFEKKTLKNTRKIGKCKSTEFKIYITFFLSLLQECPGGIVQEETFKEIYGKFFPHGSKSLYFFCSPPKLVFNLCPIYFFS